MFTEYKFDRSYILDKIAEHERICAGKGNRDFLGTALRVIARRLAKDPLSYRSYGPYWWALKRVLAAHGYSDGDVFDETVERAYRGRNDTETVVMADEFAEYYRHTFFWHSNQFAIDPDAVEPYVLIDSEYDLVAQMMSD